MLHESYYKKVILSTEPYEPLFLFLNPFNLICLLPCLLACLFFLLILAHNSTPFFHLILHFIFVIFFFSHFFLLWIGVKMNALVIFEHPRNVSYLIFKSCFHVLTCHYAMLFLARWMVSLPEQMERFKVGIQCYLGIHFDSSS